MKCPPAQPQNKESDMTTPASTTLYMRPDRNLALELVRVTEAGGL
jgi:hypothetical protein